MENHNPFLLRPDELMRDWKNIRQEIKALSEDGDKFLLAAKYWAQAPLMKRAYDIEDCEHIPGPWEMMTANNWCPESVAIGMEFTLRLAGIDTNRMALVLIRDYEQSEQFLCLEIDNDKYLNYCVGEITPKPIKGIDEIGRFVFNGRSYCRFTQIK